MRFRVKLASHGYLTRLKACELFTLSALTGPSVCRGNKGYEKKAINIKKGEIEREKQTDDLN